MEWVNGKVLTRADLNQAWLDAMASYMAFLHRQFPAQAGAAFEDLVHMIEVNTAEGLGHEATRKLARLDGYESMVSDASAVEIDGRMLPHEWLLRDGAYVKTDSLDHHDDHFYPGCQNVAWDMAGVCVEFDLTPPQQDYLLDRYARLTTDDNVERRLPFYLMAYLAFRLGYATMATQSLGSSLEAERFQKAAHRYAERLYREIAHL
jgi:hypothetical protein